MTMVMMHRSYLGTFQLLIRLYFRYEAMMMVWGSLSFLGSHWRPAFRFFFLLFYFIFFVFPSNVRNWIYAPSRKLVDQSTTHICHKILTPFFGCFSLFSFFLPLPLFWAPNHTWIASVILRI
ncbi:uncharacterized protein BO80DRAFT_22246 [Aspergillus ibericus CBS 121593]|uniref:Uncharacterized protein n=1 Tax=Aspergillus ibericus CBS 121593 TaxID=1448316 RepID=A0A395H513_9EURO|nr:hypothetical protein BO80DRAFT_22246 [Aspergillus ibericus CBS 121593]RAL02957.1 hypothetical protein BO80DRAFT_22246 [Aspergillus ibericus CBS 121593]